jgi:hypothetical protein
MALLPKEVFRIELSPVKEATPELICRHCKKGIEEHAVGQCLFDSTTWAPMTEEECAEWRKSFLADIGKLGGDFIREQLTRPSLYERLKNGKK